MKHMYFSCTVHEVLQLRFALDFTVGQKNNVILCVISTAPTIKLVQILYVVGPPLQISQNNFFILKTLEKPEIIAF